jgi:cell division protein FtsI (penicillin-binding protein 3)
MMHRVRRNVDLIAKHGLKLLRLRKREAPKPSETAASVAAPSKPLFSRPKLPTFTAPTLPQLPEMASDLRSVRRRSTIVGSLVIAGLLGMGWRGWGIAVEHHAEYAAQGNRQQLRTYTLAASRGNIVDRNHISLAVNDRLERIVINPRLIRAHGRQDEALEFLLSMFGPEHAEYIASELERDKAYRRLRLPLDADQVAAVRGSTLPGMRLEQEPHRVYPRGSLVAHVLGRVNAQGEGNLGVELGLNDELAGREASSPAYYAAFGGVGHKLLVDGHPDHGISRGRTAVLTIDSAIQAMAEQELDALVREWHPVGASVIVLDPQTGEILALANRPSFDPNHPVASASQTVNLAVQHAYEPGSTLKAITVAAALEQGTIRPDQTFFCGKVAGNTRPSMRSATPSAGAGSASPRSSRSRRTSARPRSTRRSVRRRSIAGSVVSTLARVPTFRFRV